MVRIFVISIRILVISLNILMDYSCQLFLTRAHVYAKQVVILHFPHFQHLSWVSEVSEVWGVFLLYK